MRKRWLGRLLLASFFGVGVCAAACNGAGLTQPAGPTGTATTDPPVDDEDGGPVGDAAPRNPKGDLDGGDLPLTHDVKIQVIPSDKAAAVLAAVSGAKKSVHMTMYLLSDSRFIDALIALKTAGKDVKVILNQNFPDNSTDNTATFTKLQSKGVDVTWAPAGYQYTHAKTIVIDGDTLLVMTMNLTFSSPTSNREYIATDTDPDDVAIAEQVFTADHDNKALTVSTKLLLSPQTASSVDARQRLVALIDSATSTLEVAGETLSDTKIVDALVAAKAAGVQVKIVIDKQDGTTAQQAAIAELKQAGVPIVSLGSPDMHAKAIVADGKKVYVGSMNFTTNSLYSNREVGLITDAQTEVTKVQQTILADFAAGTAL